MFEGNGWQGLSQSRKIFTQRSLRLCAFSHIEMRLFPRSGGSFLCILVDNRLEKRVVCAMQAKKWSIVKLDN